MLRHIALFSVFLVASVMNLSASSAPATYRIAGIVVDSATGQPLENAEVTIASVANPQEQQAVLTSSTGCFVFANVPPGKYRLMSNRRGYANQAFQQHEGYSTGIAVGPGLDSEHIRFPLAPSSVITGVVTDDWGDPVREAKVLLFQQSTFEGSRALRNVNQAVTDDQGRYRFAHLLSGTYAVAVYAHPWYSQDEVQHSLIEAFRNQALQRGVQTEAELEQFKNMSIVNSENGGNIETDSLSQIFDVVYPITFFPNAKSLAEASRFSLAPGATETADLQLRAVPSVHLRVRVPVQSTPVAVTSGTDDSEENSQDTIGATPEVDSSPDVALALKIGDAYTDQIEPAHKQIAPGIVELSGIPPGQFEVNMMTGSIVNMMTGQEDSVVSHGRTLNLSGDTELDLSAQGDAAAVSGNVISSQFSQAIAAAKQTPPDPAASGDAAREKIAVDQPASEEAAMIEALQERVSNATLTFRSIKTGESYSATVSDRGKFTFASSSLPAGAYEVEFTEGSLRVSSLEATGATISGRTVEIPAGQPVNLSVHAAEANCALSGIALKNGKPAAGAMVLLVPQDPGHDISLYHRDQSDSDGSFSMQVLFPGRYILLAIENGWNLEWADPKVMFQYLPAGQPLELKPGASLTLNAKVQ